MTVAYGEFQVVGRREYRGNRYGDRFEDRLDRPSTARAVTRGDLRLLRVVIPEVQPGSWTLPDGWLSENPSTRKE